MVGAQLSPEVRLREHRGGAAGGRVGTADNGEQVVDTAVGRAVRIVDEARLADWTVGGDERRNSVVGAGRPRHGDLWIWLVYAHAERRARAAHRGLGVAT